MVPRRALPGLPAARRWRGRLVKDLRGPGIPRPSGALEQSFDVAPAASRARAPRRRDDVPRPCVVVAHASPASCRSPRALARRARCSGPVLEPACSASAIPDPTHRVLPAASVARSTCPTPSMRVGRGRGSISSRRDGSVVRRGRRERADAAQEHLVRGAERLRGGVLRSTALAKRGRGRTSEARSGKSLVDPASPAMVTHLVQPVGIASDEPIREREMRAALLLEMLNEVSIQG